MEYQAPFITIKIDRKTLDIQMEAHGYRGGGCVSDLDYLTDLLDAEVLDRKPKPEIFMTQIYIQNYRGG